MCNMPQCAKIKTYGQNQPEARRADRERLERVNKAALDKAKATQ